MKQFKDMTAADFNSHISMNDYDIRPTGKSAHISFFKSTTDRFLNVNNPMSSMTDAILNVPTVKIDR